MTDAWMAEVVVVNESNDISAPGVVQVYRNGSEACLSLEPWWVQDRKGFALTGAGDRIVFSTDEHAVSIQRFEPEAGGLKLLDVWLRHAAMAVLERRAQLAKKGRARLSAAELAGRTPTTIEGLIAYVGFERL